MRLDFDFKGGAGYAIARRGVDLDLPPNYAFTFQMTAVGNVPINDLEFKLLDKTGDNVWWYNRRNFTYPTKWTEISTRKRHITFAWGPLGGGEAKHIAGLEIVVTAGKGGKGTLLVDDLTLTELPPAITGAKSFGEWRAKEGVQQNIIDLGVRREIGGLRIQWDPDDYARDFVVELSRDGKRFDVVREVTGNRRLDQFLYLPDQEARFIRLTTRSSARGEGYVMRGIEVEPFDWAATPNDFFALLAKEAPRGDYPRYLKKEQSYWTSIGADGGEEEVLFNEDGAVEPFKGSFSIEPFLDDGGLITWADVQATHELAGGDLPIPSVVWKARDLTLTTTAAVTRDSSMLMRYRIARSAGAGERRVVKLLLAIRPFQVNPSTQWLNLVGGVAKLERLTYAPGEGGLLARLSADDGREIFMTPATRFGSATYDEGNVVDYLRRGEAGASAALERIDPTGHLSGVLEYELVLGAGEQRDVYLAASIDGKRKSFDRIPSRLEEVGVEWRKKLRTLRIDIPAAPDIANTMRTSMAYMLMHRDGPSLEPGTRSYDRAWIRDGALMAALLIRFGHADVAKDFATWFAKYQFPDGKVPCCVDWRGADPVPENDSHGQLIYLVAEIYRYTKDRALLENLWPNVDAAAKYIEKLRSENHGQFEGLVTESISHEGYSAKPMHSYWDDFFALKGVEDAIELAGVLGLGKRQAELRVQAEDFRKDLLASIHRTMVEHGIDYIPGAAELGDFDPTSTAIAISPLGMTSLLPEMQLRRTFERYLESLEKPRADYTPYEMRIIGAMVRLGERNHVEKLVERFLRDRRPAAWNEWGEVVSTDLRRPIFVGDMPHAWIASDFVRSIFDAIAFDREDGALVIAAGIPRSWYATAPMHVGPLATYGGTIEVKVRSTADGTEIDLAGSAKPPRLILRSPDERPIKTARVNGRNVQHSGGEIVIPKLPAHVRFTY